jgi:hypothetical protein
VGLAADRRGLVLPGVRHLDLGHAVSAATATRRRPFRLTRPVVPEHPLQRQLADILRLEIAPPGKVSRHGVVWWAIDHANFAGEVPGIRIGRGIIAGIPDFYILHNGRAHHPEVKTTAGALSEAQQSVSAAILGAGGRVGVVTDAAQLVACLDEWRIPRAGRVRL